MTVTSGGRRHSEAHAIEPITKAEALRVYAEAAETLSRCIMLGNVAAECGNPARAAEHLLSALDEVGGDLLLLAQYIHTQ